MGTLCEDLCTDFLVKTVFCKWCCLWDSCRLWNIMEKNVVQPNRPQTTK